MGSCSSFRKRRGVKWRQKTSKEREKICFKSWDSHYARKKNKKKEDGEELPQSQRLEWKIARPQSRLRPSFQTVSSIWVPRSHVCRRENRRCARISTEVWHSTHSKKIFESHMVSTPTAWTPPINYNRSFTQLDLCCSSTFSCLPSRENRFQATVRMVLRIPRCRRTRQRRKPKSDCHCPDT